MEQNDVVAIKAMIKKQCLHGILEHLINDIEKDNLGKLSILCGVEYALGRFDANYFANIKPFYKNKFIDLKLCEGYLKDLNEFCENGYVGYLQFINDMADKYASCVELKERGGKYEL